ncbi:Mut7-C RNAse domain-containing protein [Massilia sp. LjRoot122]|uniref:Mut7-C RNAse domain-containing protein n=1 Tax=Massilia sp. LjRoot122 TaxID=3342257 RepID=UPI003ECDDE1E
MVNASFRFYDGLGDFLPRERRGREFDTPCAREATVKHMIEALGVPHTELELILVNGEPAGFEHLLREGDRVAVYPAFGQFEVRPLRPLRAWPEGRLRFVADAHLGGLARLLRMAGYDTLYDNHYHDDEIEGIAREEGRVLLTRDRELLKRRTVELGCYLHAIDPPEQLRELFARLRLGGGMRPFTLCLHCNLPLRPVAKDEVLARLPPRVAETHEDFTTCDACGRVYWKGSHHARMQGLLEGVAAAPTEVKLPPTPDFIP